MTEGERVRLAKLLKGSVVAWDEDYVVVTPSDKTDIAFIQDAISKLGYERDFDTTDLTISVSNAQAAWSAARALYFYRDRKGFWLDYSSIPKFCYFYITECGSTSLSAEETDLTVALNCYASWRSLFLELSDHLGTPSSSETFVFFVGGEKGARKYSVTPQLALNKVLSIATPIAHDTARRLLEYLHIKDAQDTERRETMRVALMDFFDDLEVGAKDLFSQSMEKHDSLLSKYVESFDTLIHRYSINKALEEVAEKSIDYVNKLNDTISTAQNKAFAIPGAMIAIAALVRTFGVAEAVLVLVGLWMVKIITKGTNEIQLSTLDNLEFEVRQTFTRYRKTAEEAAVKSKADAAMLSVLGMIAKAKVRIKGVDRLSNVMLLVALGYMLYRAIPIYVSPFIFKMCSIGLWAS
ncbi:hypothetical protein [Pseudomonas abieticivorans]|uniref:hypothetical protein n=1 Tax=Pseudomonas abieticivorans TaxID=2931382 RepID=UPI0020C15775|nr:hypothetical protein [Pseudomonas sp. PIA16]